MTELLLFLQSALITLLVSVAGCLIGIPLGLAIAVGRVRKILVLTPFLAVYVSFIRSLPLVLFVMLFYFGLPILGVNLNPYVAGVLALALNNAAFSSEIWRGAIVDFSVEQVDAARAFGMTQQQTFWRVMLPQVWRASIPPITSEVTLLLKASPAVGIIGINELTRRASALAASNYEPLRMLLTATLLYMIVILAITQVGRRVEHHFHSQYELV
ncbi:MAG: amino acid ABC transporter permease [Oculatellaceae cyanobacterium bins.114]|nr:amino acid ABC transporter permease [Oculatellaceae cyanobacterium bins.114]